MSHMKEREREMEFVVWPNLCSEGTLVLYGTDTLVQIVGKRQRLTHSSKRFLGHPGISEEHPASQTSGGVTVPLGPNGRKDLPEKLLRPRDKAQGFDTYPDSRNAHYS